MLPIFSYVIRKVSASFSSNSGMIRPETQGLVHVHQQQEVHAQVQNAVLVYVTQTVVAYRGQLIKTPGLFRDSLTLSPVLFHGRGFPNV